MSLQTDRIFFAAIAADSDIVAAVGNRIYSTAIPLPDEDADNVPAPYIIVSFDGMTNLEGTKDCSYEGREDNVKVGVMIVATTRDALADLSEKVRTAIPAFFTSYEAPTNEPVAEETAEEAANEETASEETTEAATEEEATSEETTEEPTVNDEPEPEPEPVEDLSDLIPLDYTLSSGPVSFDADKPGYWLELTYDCYTNK